MRLSLPPLLLAAGIILTMGFLWLAVGNFRGAKPIAEQNLTGTALSLAEAIETLAARDPSLESVAAFRTDDISYVAIIDRGGRQIVHSNPDLTNTLVADRRYREVFEGSGVHESRERLRSGEEVFEMNTPLHIRGDVYALRLVLHTYRADNVVRRSRVGMLMIVTLLTVAWIMGLSLYGFARREERHREALAIRERMAQLGEMGAVLAHEIRNPLAGIKGYAQLLQEGLRGSVHAGYLGLIVTETLRLEELVNALMSYARQEQGSPEPVDLSALVEHTLSVIRPEAATTGVTLTTEIPAGIEIIGSRNGLAQVMLNILNNALQAMPEGGSLGVEVLAAPGWVTVAVSDTGPGVPPEERERIFEPFHTTKPRGTGLGLAVCRKIVSEHGGRISVTGGPGGGARFVVALPVAGKG